LGRLLPSLPAVEGNPFASRGYTPKLRFGFGVLNAVRSPHIRQIAARIYF
jgi:hypothetical protein